MAKATQMGGASNFGPVIVPNVRGNVREERVGSGSDWHVGGAAFIGGNISIGAQIVPGAAFRGINGEVMAFGAGEMASAAALNVGSGLPRLTLPDAATTDAFVQIIPPPWWFPSGVLIAAEVVNDHAAGGNVRIEIALLQFTVGAAVASPTNILAAVASTAAAPTAGQLGTLNLAGFGTGAWPQSTGAVQAFRFSRLGGDGADTLAGALGLVSIRFLKSV